MRKVFLIIFMPAFVCFANVQNVLTEYNFNMDVVPAVWAGAVAEGSEYYWGKTNDLDRSVTTDGVLPIELPTMSVVTNLPIFTNRFTDTVAEFFTNSTVGNLKSSLTNFGSLTVFLVVMKLTR